MTDPAQSREWNSSVYHKLSAPQVSWGKKVLSRLYLRGDEYVLDAGCGTGRLTADLIDALPNGQVVGVDLSQNMLASAREHLENHLGSNLNLVAADLQSLPFERAFDGIVSTAAFHWVRDHTKLFTSLHRALKHGGWLHAQCGGGANIAHLRRRVAGLTETFQYTQYFENFVDPWFFASAEQAADLLKAAGFVNVQTSEEAAPTVLDDAGYYEDFVSNIVLRAHLRQLPTEKLRRMFMAQLTELAAKDDPPFSIDYWRLNLSGNVE